MKKKLKLSKETLRDLSSGFGQRVGAGTQVPTHPEVCGYSGGCSASCDWTCMCQSDVYVCEQPPTRDSICAYQ